MPSACCVCKRVKQIGDTVSFHKFPFQNKEVCEKWIEFVKNASKDSDNVVRKITKFSSICSQHFKATDILENGANSRKSLKRHAIPLINIRQVYQMPPVIIVEEEQTENYEFCGLCRTLSRERSLILIDDNNFSIMRKCLPFVNFNLSLMQKICYECNEILNTFSSFIDRVIVAQNMLNQEVPIRRIDEIPRSIKLEPLIEDDLHVPMLAPKNFEEHLALQTNRTSTNQKKCEILEIVDIKPFNFLPFETNALTCEISEQNIVNDTSYEEDEIQILSPKQLKVEINDQDDGENELELIKNYVYISTIFMHDHNYVKESNHGNNVKTEFDEDIQVQSSRSITPSSTQELVHIKKVCCKRKFNSFKQFLLHKVTKHKSKDMARDHCALCRKRFTTKRSLNFHKRFNCKTNIQHMKAVKINYTKFLTELKEKRIKNIQRKPRRTSFICKICNKTFKGSKNLYQHKNATHRQSKHKCNICDKSFKMKHGLKQHIKAQHEKKKLFNCAICNHSFALKGDLKRCRHSDLKRKT
ncbi:unnamed protein product [Chironomus riparius]|uniref:Uncharacterized protein n=1 Tax=Chironomus riparius TaxID=315576 RepID=A0A9N9RWA5_9DIPT|nr:unnamed protein product [Chironomus riparius]